MVNKIIATYLVYLYLFVVIASFPRAKWDIISNCGKEYFLQTLAEKYAKENPDCKTLQITITEDGDIVYFDGECIEKEIFY